MAAPTIVVPNNQPVTNNIQQMAYGSGSSQTSPYRTFRVERGKPVYRRGVQVTVTPQFKGLTIYSPTTANTPSPGFQKTTTNVAVVWPQRHLST